MTDVVKKAGKLAATGAALAVVVQTVVQAEWDDETGRVDKVKLFGLIPVFDRRRMEARRARRAARRAK